MLLDDHALFRESLSRLLASEPGMEVVGECGTPAEALEILKSRPADIILLDFKLGTDDGHGFLSSAQKAGVRSKILIVTAGMGTKESLRALQLGAAGIFLKNNPPSSLVTAIRLVAEGEAWLDRDVVRVLAEGFPQRDDGTFRGSLTLREQQVVQGVVDGMTNRAIGDRIGVSEGAVKTVLQQLFRKAGVRNRGQLIRVITEGTFPLS